ncbi:hypothetical protein [Paenibacillus sp. TH7-28]
MLKGRFFFNFEIVPIIAQALLESGFDMAPFFFAAQHKTLPA